MRALARRLVYPGVEALTVVALSIRAGFRGARAGAQPLRAVGRDTVLVIAAHPDDETIGCAGAIAAHLAAGDRVHVLIVTDGRGSRAGGLSPDEMSRRRGEEVARVAALFPGARFEELRLPENAWRPEQLTVPLAAHLDSCKPTLVYAPSCVDFHPEHMKVARVAAYVLQQRTGPRVRIYEMQVPLGIELANLYLPLGASYDTKTLAIDTYSTQRGALDLWKRQARYNGSMFGAHRSAEVFWEVTSRGYGFVAAAGRWTWKTTPFRSLGGRPLADLAAHLRGARTRRILREAAGAGDVTGERIVYNAGH